MAATPWTLKRSGPRASVTRDSGVAKVKVKVGPKKKRALVTGGAGFLGSHLSERLLAEGYRVVCMDNLSTGVLENVASLLSREADFEFIDNDVSDSVEVPGELDEIYH